VKESERKVPMVNLAASQEVERLLRLGAGKGSRSAERKRARGPHRHEDHNNCLWIILVAPEQKSGAFFEHVFCRASVSDAKLWSTRRRQNLFGTATVFSARPNLLELDSLECNSTFRELIPTFEEDSQSHPTAIAIFCTCHMTYWTSAWTILEKQQRSTRDRAAQ
jgi:hypothetical protein